MDTLDNKNQDLKSPWIFMSLHDGDVTFNTAWCLEQDAHVEMVSEISLCFYCLSSTPFD